MKNYKSPDGKVYAYEEDGSQDHLIPEDYVQITDVEAQEFSDEVGRLRTEELYANATYAEKRSWEYPSFAQQFDLLYHGGYDAWKIAIDAVKNKYPKE